MWRAAGFLRIGTFHPGGVPLMRGADAGEARIRSLPARTTACDRRDEHGFRGAGCHAGPGSGLEDPERGLFAGRASHRRVRGRGADHRLAEPSECGEGVQDGACLRPVLHCHGNGAGWAHGATDPRSGADSGTGALAAGHRGGEGTQGGPCRRIDPPGCKTRQHPDRCQRPRAVGGLRAGVGHAGRKGARQRVMGDPLLCATRDDRGHAGRSALGHLCLWCHALSCPEWSAAMW